MGIDLAIVLALLAAAVAMFAINRPRMDAVALIMLTVLPFTGSVTMGQALAGFADPNIVLIAALFVIGDGLVRTGIARQLGDWLIRSAGSNETRLLVLLMIVVCGLGSLMSSTAVTAIFIPVALRISQQTGTSAGRLMMPISFAALISGMTTLVATAPNLVINSELVRRGSPGFSFFSFTPFGVPILLVGIVYMVFARNWLSTEKRGISDKGHRPTLANWIEEYQLAAHEHRVRILSGSSLIGKSLAELNMRQKAGANLIAIERNNTVIQPTDKSVLQVNDILLVDLFVPSPNLEQLLNQYSLAPLPLSGAYFSDRAQDIGMAEVILPASSDLIGNTVCESRFRARYGLTVIGLRRGKIAHGRELQDDKLKLGDTLLLIGPWKSIKNLQTAGKELVVLNLPAEMDEVLPVAGKAPQALLSLALVVGLMVSGVVPNVQAALIGCLLMGALGCIDLNSAYRAIDWKTLVLIVGMLPFSIALQKTGGVDLVANGLMSVIGAAGPHVILASLFIITALLGLFISNTATAVLMGPVALAIAEEMHVSPYPFAMIVALAASTAFMTPVSSPVNTLVVGPGNYSFGDFVKVGAPFAVIVLIISVLMVPWLLPL